MFDDRHFDEIKGREGTIYLKKKKVAIKKEAGFSEMREERF